MTENLPTTKCPDTIIEMALSRGADEKALERLEKVLEIKERYDALEAKKAYYVAIAKFKAKPPKIWRDMQVKYEVVGGKPTMWSHADLATAAEAINKSLGKHGLNSTWRTLPLENNKTRVTCIIAHEFGHSEETYLEAGPDKTGSKNDIQAIGSTIFYLERYTLFALTGLAPARMDDDGQGTGEVKYISEKQLSTIRDLMAEKNMTESRMLKFAEVENLEMILAENYEKTVVAIKRTKKIERQPDEDDNRR